MQASVLIVDADAVFAAQAQTILEGLGLTVHVRDDAPIEVLRRLRPTILLVNVELAKSGASGFSICSRIRRDKDLRDTPILLTSAEQSLEALRRHAETPDHADDYALKPLDGDDLLGRIGRLLERAVIPPDAPADPDAAGDTAEVAPQAPPPLPGGTSPGGPPPLPGGPPPLRRAPASLPTAADVQAGRASIPAPMPEVAWRAIAFDEMMRARLPIEAPSAPGNASADQRVAFLRAQAKYLESREKTAREAWDELQEQGRDLERRFHALRIELQKKDEQIAAFAGEIERGQVQLAAVQTEFATFQGEITRIFEEKDGEERATLARLAELEQETGQLQAQLEETKQQREDDLQRLRIFQGEVDSLQEQLEGAGETQAQLQASEKQLGDLKARLEMTEALAGERAAELETLRERLDVVAIDAANERRQIEEQAEQRLLERDAQHEANLQARDEELADSRAELEQANIDLGAQLEASIEAEQNVRAELSQALAERDALAQVREELQSALEEQRLDAQAQEAALRDRLSELEQDLTAQTEVLAELGSARDQLEAALANAREELATADADLGARNRELEQLESEIAELAPRAQEADASVQRLADAEAELDELRSGLFERLAELDQLRSSLTGGERRTHELERALQLADRRAAEAEARVNQLEGQLSGERGEAESLSDRLTEAEAAREAAEQSEQATQRALEEEQQHRERYDAMLRKAKEKISELQKRLEESTTNLRAESARALEEEQQARQELDDRLAEVESELTRRELEAAEATRQNIELERELEVMREKLQSNIESREQKLAALAGDLDQARQQLSVEADRSRIMLEDLRERDTTEGELRAQLTAKSQMLERSQQDLAATKDLLNKANARAEEQTRRAELMSRLVDTLRNTKNLLEGDAERGRAPGKAPPPPPPPPPVRRGADPAHREAPAIPPPVAARTKPPPASPAGSPFGALMQEAGGVPGRLGQPRVDPRGDAAKPGRRKIKPIEGDHALDEAARLLSHGLPKSHAPVDLSTARDPFGPGSGLPEEQAGDQGRSETDGAVTEVVRLDDLK
ncbi:MAG: response regulator [Deltaproteobacteria bacterium]|nr:response regulator [Deltaproteobacteria bacterium]